MCDNDYSFLAAKPAPTALRINAAIIAVTNPMLKLVKTLPATHNAAASIINTRIDVVAVLRFFYL